MSDRRTEKQNAARRRARGGFTIAEMLVAILILGLVSGGVAEGIRFGAEQYQKSMQLSEARVLCSTLTSIIQDELGNTHKITVKADGTLYSFFSRNYAVPKSTDGSRLVAADPDSGSELDADKYGELKMMGTGPGELDGLPLLSSASYTSFKLRVNPTVKYSGGVFTVTLKIRPAGASEDTLTSTFFVLPLNKLETKVKGTP